jgi:hypothetical protein
LDGGRIWDTVSKVAEGGDSGDYTDLFALIEARASEWVRLSPEQIHEVAAAVVVDLWTLLQKDPEGVSELLADPSARDEWVSKRLANAFRRLLHGDRRSYRWREVDLGFDAADSKSSLEAVEAVVALDNIAGQLSLRELQTLGLLLEGYAQDLPDKTMASRAGVGEKTFHERKQSLFRKLRPMFE